MSFFGKDYSLKTKSPDLVFDLFGRMEDADPGRRQLRLASVS
jgi:hypothetical protein